jgi:hypothetical protein
MAASRAPDDPIRLRSSRPPRASRGTGACTTRREYGIDFATHTAVRDDRDTRAEREAGDDGGAPLRDDRRGPLSDAKGLVEGKTR